MKKRPYHMLIVDDEASILDMLEEYFQSQKFRVFRAADAEQAIAIMNDGQEDIDLLITDIDLPGMSGIDLLRIVRETKPDIPVIMVTGYKTLDFAILAIKHGAHDYVTKPFELTDVRKSVEKVLRYRVTSQKRDKIFRYANALNINFDIPTHEVDAGVLAQFLARFLLNSGFCNKEMYHQYYVAFMETLINAIEHGNLELPSAIKGSDFEKLTHFEELRERRLRDPEFNKRLIRVAFMYNPECFTLTITDDGPGFDWKPHVAAHMNIYSATAKAYGRGFMLIHHVIDEIYFNDKGNSITLVKSKPARETE